MTFTEKEKSRFMNFVCPEPNTGCWLWVGAQYGNGYGHFTIGTRKLGYKTYSAHRVSFTINVGGIKNGLFVLHKCDVRACVNPDHLFLGTQKDNIRDCLKKKRMNLSGLKLGHSYRHLIKKTHCKKGHIFDEDNTKYKKNSTHRICIKCVNEASRLFQIKVRQKRKEQKGLV